MVHQGKGNRLTRAVRQHRGLRGGIVAFTTLVALALPVQARADDSTPVAPEITAAVAELPIPSPPDLSTTVALPPDAPSVDVVAVVQAALDAASSDVAPAPAPPVADPVVQAPNGTQISPQPSVSQVVPTEQISPDPGETTTSTSLPLESPDSQAGSTTSSSADPAQKTDPAPSPSATQTRSTTATPSSPAAPGLPASSSTTDAGQYQNGNQTDIKDTNSPPMQPTETPTQAVESSEAISPDSLSSVPQNWTWNWSWNCADDSIGTSTTSPASETGGTGWVWNWRWSCGADPTASCTACNTAVAIRILSPGDDGDLAQSISSTSTSVAQTISSTLQQSVQQILPPVSSQPSALQVPSPLPAIDATPWPSLELTVPVLPVLPAWPTISAGLAAEPATSSPLLLLAGIEAISLDDAGGGVIELPTLGVPPLDDSVEAIFGSSRSFGVAGAAYTAAAARAPLQERVGQVLAPPRHKEAAAAGGASQSPSKPRVPLRLPAQGPLGFGPDLSNGASASGSSSSLGGFALLLGALLIVVPSALQLIWVGAATRPRRYTPGPPEHPG